jgi:hypothetical protein
VSWSQHLARGVRILGERWFDGPRRWIAAGENGVDKAVRMVMVGAAGYVLWRALSASWKVLLTAVFVVVVLALRAATKAAKAPPQKPAKAAVQAPPEPGEDLPREAFQAAVWDVLGTAPAVHLTTLATHLAERTGRPWDGPQVRAACTTHQIPIRPKVRDLGGDRVSSGVHRDDLDPLPEPLPGAAQEGHVADYTAGQDGNATPLHGPHATAPTPQTRRVGDLRITSVPDPAEPYRTHVTVTNPTRRRAGKS